MPFASEAQRRKLWATDPATAQKIYDDTPKSERGKKLPYHARASKRKARRK